MGTMMGEKEGTRKKYGTFPLMTGVEYTYLYYTRMCVYVYLIEHIATVAHVGSLEEFTHIA